MAVLTKKVRGYCKFCGKELYNSCQVICSNACQQKHAKIIVPEYMASNRHVVGDRPWRVIQNRVDHCILIGEGYNAPLLYSRRFRSTVLAPRFPHKKIYVQPNKTLRLMSFLKRYKDILDFPKVGILGPEDKPYIFFRLELLVKKRNQPTAMFVLSNGARLKYTYKYRGWLITRHQRLMERIRGYENEYEGCLILVLTQTKKKKVDKRRLYVFSDIYTAALLREWVLKRSHFFLCRKPLASSERKKDYFVRRKGQSEESPQKLWELIGS